ncbi:hypothetical protein KJ765_04750 [Candidatus Micrarchaeota archaeon]|nr:hypothetical protein [Candidatus Micrarchaeota archaeon]
MPKAREERELIHHAITQHHLPNPRFAIARKELMTKMQEASVQAAIAGVLGLRWERRTPTPGRTTRKEELRHMQLLDAPHPRQHYIDGLQELLAQTGKNARDMDERTRRKHARVIVTRVRRIALLGRRQFEKSLGIQQMIRPDEALRLFRTAVAGVHQRARSLRAEPEFTSVFRSYTGMRSWKERERRGKK